VVSDKCQEETGNRRVEKERAGGMRAGRGGWGPLFKDNEWQGVTMPTFFGVEVVWGEGDGGFGVSVGLDRENEASQSIR
jgi:hypothetical protein